MAGGRMIFVFLILIAYAFGEEILGCGGFVKTDLEINLSQVEVKLYTKQGSLKDHTDCAPNNGYYFLPIYDKGDYILKIEPPSGWSFQPREVALTFDGVTDPCSLGKDINFSLLGFAVKGKVTSAGSNNGPKNLKVSLDLHTPNGLKPYLKTVTGENGVYAFTPVLPGKYTVSIEHPKWILEKRTAEVEVKSGNTVLPDKTLVVKGYDASGKVTSEDEPIRDVSFVLFHADKTAPPINIQGCSKAPLAGFEGSGALCHVVSNTEGIFEFPSLPPNRYKVVPHYQGPQSLQFDVQPKQMEFTIKQDSLQINTPFQVTGFSVSGRVLAALGGQGLEGAAVHLDGKPAINTRPDGSYHFENMRAGNYIIQVQAKDMRFEEVVAKVSPNTPILPPIVPSAFKVCGKVLPYHFHQESVEKGSKFVLLSKDGSTSPPIIVETKATTGEFCHLLEPGKYEAKVEVTDVEKSKGLQFYPPVLVINVKDRPILTGIEFSQLKVTLSGSVVCLYQTCPQISVSLQLAESNKTNIATTLTKDGKYTFENLLPGKYQVSIEKGDWCWESTIHTLSVGSIQSSAPDFKQTGFAVTFISSHETQVEYKLEAPTPAPGAGAEAAAQPAGGASGKLVVQQGTSKMCIKAQGTYRFRATGCHGYANDALDWSTANAEKPVKLTAISHMLGGSIVAADDATNVFVDVKYTFNNTLKTRLGPLKSEPKNGAFIFRFNLLVLEEESIYFEPTHGLLLFDPLKLSIIGGDSCVEDAVKFSAENGKIVEGKMVPPSAGISVTIRNELDEVIVIAETDSAGKFRVGPLPGKITYKVSAEKEGSIISGPDKHGNFNVHKLAQIDVTVVDKADSKQLQGVLLSLSGGDSFRRNSQTNAEGKLTFTSLSPGEYYLRPMMKEYRFEPTSSMITVKEGATFSLSLQGHRIAYSAFGTVTSLNGEPEEGIVVEAIGQGSCSQQEEASTESNGQFRIRGLKANCEYVVRVKEGVDVNEHIQRGTPGGIKVKVKGDVFDLKLVAFQRVTHMDLTAHVSAPSFQHLRTLKVKLCREDAPDSPIHIVKLDSPSSKIVRTHSNAMVLFPNIPIDNREYFVQLESTITKVTHSFTHVVHFKANTTFKHLTLVFEAELKAADQELGQTSFLALVVLGVLLLLYLNSAKVRPMLASGKKMLDSMMVPAPVQQVSTKKNNDFSEREPEVLSVEPISMVKRKVKSRKT